jgi:hypothetical protein
MQADGYGVCYGIRDECVIASVSALFSCPRTSARALREALRTALGEIRFLLEQTNAPAARM